MRLSSLFAAAALSSAAPAAAATLHPERVAVENTKDFDVATNGSVILAVWTDTAAGVVRGRYFDAETAEPTGATVSLPCSRKGFPDTTVASDGEGFLIAWVDTVDGRVVRATRVSADGAITGPELVLDDGDPHGSVDAAWNGSLWLVAWSQVPPDIEFPYADTFATRISADFELLDPVRFNVTYGGGPQVATQGENFLVLATELDSGRPLLSIVRPDGTRLGHRATVETSSESPGAVAGDGTEIIRIFSDYGAGSEGLYLAALVSNRERRFSESNQRVTRASFASGRFLIAWDEGVEIRASRMTADMRLLDGAAGQKILGRSARLAEIVDLGDRAVVFAWRGRTVVARVVEF